MSAFVMSSPTALHCSMISSGVRIGKEYLVGGAAPRIPGVAGRRIAGVQVPMKHRRSTERRKCLRSPTIRAFRAPSIPEAWETRVHPDSIEFKD